ncbi:hypothetical protein GQ55_9G507800 [Panicum hallii var. hallii]|uniref:Uncharacterized protein n=1 Tax=Panicum hallii var. hallii TaxID=1504633 RepID=A0A2T7CDT0_9POAL|nr:hypothetical protein GQ55_9G507800 [Panicum hallii var. hallii]
MKTDVFEVAFTCRIFQCMKSTPEMKENSKLVLQLFLDQKTEEGSLNRVLEGTKRTT